MVGGSKIRSGRSLCKLPFTTYHLTNPPTVLHGDFRLSTENIEKFMGNMGFSKQKIWENYGSFMGFTVKSMAEIAVNLR